MNDGDEERDGAGGPDAGDPRFLPDPTDAVREFRHERPWLREDVDHDGPKAFDYRHPTDGTVLYYGYRLAPGGREALLFLANMEGIEATETPTDLPIEWLPSDGWELALASPGVGPVNADEPVTWRTARSSCSVASRVRGSDC